MTTKVDASEFGDDGVRKSDAIAADWWLGAIALIAAVSGLVVGVKWGYHKFF